MCHLPNWHRGLVVRQFCPYNKRVIKRTALKTYRVLLEYWTPDENENCWEEEVIHSRSSAATIADKYLSKDRTNQIRSVDVTVIN